MRIVSKHPILVGTAVLTLVSLGLYGCKNFLTDASKPQGTLDQSTLATAAGVEGTLIAAYRTLDCTTGTSSDWGCAASNWVWGTVAADEAYKGSTLSDQPPINDVEGYHWGTANASTYLNTKWRNVYEGINRANATLRLLKQVQAASPGAISPADASSIEGEATFLRAHYHFEAYRMWGAIPYYREDDTDFRKPNLAASAVPAEILKDLDAAIAKLPATPRGGQKGRATSWMAKAYKGRVLMYEGQFASAIAAFEDVKANGPYKLAPSFDEVWTGINAFRNGPEEILAYDASVNDGEPGGNNGNYGERLNFPYSGSHFQCCGFNQPTQNLVNFFKVDATTGLPLVMVDSTTWNVDDNMLGGERNTVPVDPRLDYTVGRDSVPFKDWGFFKVSNTSDSWVRDVANGGPYSPKKNAQEKVSGAESSSAGWQPQQENSVHIHLFRYADLLLMLAEAYVERNSAGDLENARAIVNQIRDRAAVRVQGCGSPVVDSVFTARGSGCGNSNLTTPMPAMTAGKTSLKMPWASYEIGEYTTPWVDQNYAREAVRTERRLELAMEGQRMFDLRRWGEPYAAARINGFINGIGGGNEKTRRLFLANAEPFVQKHMWYPIPADQIDLSKVGGTPKLTQNPGW
jgi:starch-binding outer membrane protein, SusD/RagB family